MVFYLYINMTGQVPAEIIKPIYDKEILYVRSNWLFIVIPVEGRHNSVKNWPIAHTEFWVFVKDKQLGFLHALRKCLFHSPSL